MGANMGAQLELKAYDIDGYGDTQPDPLCEHCGCQHSLTGPYCSERCAQRARSDPDEFHLSIYDGEPVYRDDRSECKHYWECSRVAANYDADRVCKDGCDLFEHDDEPGMTLLRSNMGMVLG